MKKKSEYTDEPLGDLKVVDDFLPPPPKARRPVPGPAVPFNSATDIRYQLPGASLVVLAVYDVLGQKVWVLVDSFVDAGYRSVVWGTKDMASGIYFIRMEAGDFVEVRKMALIR